MIDGYTGSRWHDCLQRWNMVMTTVAELQRAVFADPRYAARLDVLRRQWATAGTAFHAMKAATDRAEAWVATLHDEAVDRAEGARVAAALLTAEVDAYRTRCATYTAVIELAAAMLDAIAGTYADVNMTVEDARARATDDWVAVVLAHLDATCRSAENPVALF